MGERLHYDYCRQCGRPVTIKFFTADGLITAGKPPTERPWVCPHGCGLIERPQLRGRIIDAWAGHSESRPQ